jgi:predicted signal transduction protein with EAL and GGDEF domain
MTLGRAENGLTHAPLQLKGDRRGVPHAGDEGKTGHAERARGHRVIDLDHVLHLAVVAEGMKTGEQLAMLGAEGCVEAHGIHFNEAVPTKTVSAQRNQQPKLTVPATATLALR